VYFDASYYVTPEKAGEKPYALLREALRRSGYAAIAQWTAHRREHLALLRPGRSGLLMHTLFYAGEVRARDEYRGEEQTVDARELELAGLLIEALAGHFDPGKYRDAYRDNVRALVEAKIRSQEREQPGKLAPVPLAARDLLKALRASLGPPKKLAAMKARKPSRNGKLLRAVSRRS
jgi:DNA end-binding protein Ku